LLFVVAGVVAALVALTAGNRLHANSAEDARLTDMAYAGSRIAALVAQLDHEEAIRRGEAIDELARLGPEARPAASKLVDLLSDDADFKESFVRMVVRDRATAALIALGPEAISTLRRKLPSQSEESQLYSAFIARRIGPDARELLPQFVKEYETASEGPRSELLAAIAVRSQYPRVREASVQALGAIAARPPESLRALEESLADPRPFVRAAASQSIAAFGADARKAAPQLIDRLSDGYLDVRVATARALGRLGATAEDAIPALEALTDVENVVFRDSVHDALAAIRETRQAAPK